MFFYILIFENKLQFYLLLLLDKTYRLITAVKVSILPKLTEEDSIKFQALLNDVFPGVTLPLDSQSDERKGLRVELTNLCTAQSLREDVALKCIQLHDQLQSRTGVAVVGPPGSGKTLVRSLLCQALNNTGETTTQFNVFPGAVAKQKLLGRVDAQTRCVCCHSITCTLLSYERVLIEFNSSRETTPL